MSMISYNNMNLLTHLSTVSQADASERLSKAGYHVVGWYHSHPTFVPNPSLRDLETQAKYQQLFAEGNQPFLALILNPYSSHQNLSKTSLVSKYKCLMLNDQATASQVILKTVIVASNILTNSISFFTNRANKGLPMPFHLFW